MRKVFITIIGLCLLSACISLKAPADFTERTFQSRTFKLVSWQKITDPTAPYKFYIEGDGYAFNRYGRPSANPTPRHSFLSGLAFNDPSPNVIYLARPCQYTNDDFCTKRHWTTARFAPEVITALTDEIRHIAPQKKLILIGYSGGAQVAGLIATTQPDLQIKKMITVAGNLDHEAWTTSKNFSPLSESMSLSAYRSAYAKLPQIHYVGARDTVIAPALTHSFVSNPNTIVILPNATRYTGFEPVYPDIWNEH